MSRPSAAVPPGFVPPLPARRADSVPLHRQLDEGYRQAIIDGRLRPGERLPSTRSLGAELRISRLTVLTAFEQLRAEGYLDAKHGAGTFVATTLPEAAVRVRGANVPRSAVPPGARVVARPTLDSHDELWLGGLGAFRISQPAVEQFPFDVWTRLPVRHGRNPPRTQLTCGARADSGASAKCSPSTCARCGGAATRTRSSW